MALKALRTSFENHISQAKDYLSDVSSTQSKRIGCRDKLCELYDQLNKMNDEIVSALEPADIETDVLESEKVVESWSYSWTEFEIK